MHELAIAQALAELAEGEAVRLGATSVLHLRVKVGALRQIEPEMLKDAFDMARAGRLAHSDLEVSLTLPIVRCLHCGAEERLDTFDTRCRACGSTDADVSGGDELELTSMEFESDASPAPGPLDPSGGAGLADRRRDERAAGAQADPSAAGDPGYGIAH
ncbi:MAG: hydrogenase maturation nickel metallochaperone HypA [Phycisphaerales bacterium]|nr:hydrogenase maturation nickel metallochaperone HypA [Phycisphaerales bacterium]